MARLLLEMPNQQDERDAHGEIHQSHQRKDTGVLEGRGGDQLALEREFGHRDGRGLRGILQQHDHDISVRRQHDAYRLWQDHATHGEPPTHADRLRGLDLALVDGLDAGAKVLRLIRRISEAEAENGRLQRGQRDAEVGHHKVEIEQQDDNRDAADQIYQAGTQSGESAHTGDAQQRPNQPENGGQDQRTNGDDDGQPYALQKDRQEFGGVTKEFFHRFKSRSRTLRAEAPFAQNFVQRAIGLDSRERSIDLRQQLLVALANSDGDGADDGRLVGIDQANFRKAALLEVIGEDRIVGVARLEAASVHVAQDVRNGVVDFDFAEQSGLFQRIDKGRAYLGPYHFALQIFGCDIALGFGLGHDEPFTVTVDGIRKIDHFLACRRREHRRRDDVDLVRRQRGNQRRELH